MGSARACVCAAVCLIRLASIAGCSLGSMSVSDGAMVLITCANSLIFAHISELLDVAQLRDE